MEFVPHHLPWQAKLRPTWRRRAFCTSSNQDDKLHVAKAITCHPIFAPIFLLLHSCLFCPAVTLAIHLLRVDINLSGLLKLHPDGCYFVVIAVTCECLIEIQKICCICHTVVLMAILYLLLLEISFLFTKFLEVPSFHSMLLRTNAIQLQIL